MADGWASMRYVQVLGEVITQIWVVCRQFVVLGDGMQGIKGQSGQSQ